MLWDKLELITLLLLLCMVSSSSGNSSSDSGNSDDANAIGEAQIKWVRDNGGYVNPSIEFQRLSKEDPTSPFGVFTSKAMKKNETIFLIPRKCLLDSKGTLDMCDTVIYLMEERKLGKESKYAPYMEYLFEGISMPPLPYQWSDLGKELIELIVGSEISPSDITTFTSADYCGGENINEFEEEAFQIVLRRSWNDTLVPLLDMINHRNGKWYNSDSNPVIDGTDVRVFATRDIDAGEQIYSSYNECADCFYKYTYVLQHILREYSFVEQYPRRWMFFEFDEEDSLVFEVDQDHHTGKLFPLWPLGKPDEEQRRYLNGYLKRERSLQKYIYKNARRLTSSHERETILEFYDGLLTALEFGVYINEDDEQCTSAETCSFHDMNQLQELAFDTFVCDTSTFSYIYKVIEKYKTPYQQLRYLGTKDGETSTADGTCLEIGDDTIICTQSRPQYHETLVHLPASYIKHLKRVAFIGGTQWLLHEILKYPDIDLVLAFELDQKVIRKTFQYFQANAYFQLHDKVQWWFGDASISLGLIPQEYYGTFDLVIITLPSHMLQELSVTTDLSLTDAATRLLNPQGIIVTKADSGFYFDKTNYAMDIYNDDIPIDCYLAFTMGSNEKDFIKAKPIDHQYIDTLYFQLNHTQNMFYNYRKRESSYSSTQNSKTCIAGPSINTDTNTHRYGALLAIDSYNTQIQSDKVQQIVNTILRKAELTLLQTQVSTQTTFFWLKQGYLLLQSFSDSNYYAIDILLWSDIEKQQYVKNLLHTALGGEMSIFRILTSGMFGASHISKQVCIAPALADTTPNPILNDFIDPRYSAMILARVLSMVSKHETIGILCGYQDTQFCSQIVKRIKRSYANIMPIWTCPQFVNEDIPDDYLFACYTDTIQVMRDIVKETGEKISSIVIAPFIPFGMGQVLLKILSTHDIRRELVKDTHSVIELSRTQEEAAWRKILLDELRSDVMIFDPAYRAEILLYDMKMATLELGIFSSGDESFYVKLQEMLSAFDVSLGFSKDIRYIVNGINNYNSDFKPKQYSSSDYDNTDYEKSMELHEAVMAQANFRYKIDPDAKSISSDSFKDLIQSILSSFENEALKDSKFSIFENKEIGEGFIITGFWNGGALILLWNGRNEFDLNMCVYDDNVSGVLRHFHQEILNKASYLSLFSWEEHPRGIGGVMT